MEPEHATSARLRDIFDELGDAEWNRLEKDPRSRVAFEIHRRFLRRHLKAGAEVLEIGAGAGRFTIELAEMACRVLVTDISPVQLALNERYVSAAGVEAAVMERQLLDVLHLSRVPDETFDAVLAYGGPLSYAFDEAESSLAHMLRILRPGGLVVASVMTSIGTLRFFIANYLTYANQARLDVLERVMATGDNRLDEKAHPCRMFRWREIDDILRSIGGELIGASSSNFLSSGDQQVLALIEQDTSRWPRFLDWEEEFCAEPGALDSGTHMLFAVRRSASRAGAAGG